MSGLMDKAKGALSGNETAKNFSDKQVNNRKSSAIMPPKVVAEC